MRSTVEVSSISSVSVPQISQFPFGSKSYLGKPFLWNAEKALDERDQAALNLGAHMWALNEWPCDTLEVPVDGDAARQDLADWWGVEDAVKARMTVGRLLDGMHSATFEVVAPLVANAVAKTDGHHPESHRDFLAARAVARNESAAAWIADYDALYNLRTSHSLRRELTAYWFPTHIRAWDLGRLPFVVRMSLRAGYFAPDECWSMLHAALDSARSYYANWRQFGHGVVIGRGYWKALTDTADAAEAAQTASNVVVALLERSDSPWRRVPLHPA